MVIFFGFIFLAALYVAFLVAFFGRFQIRFNSNPQSFRDVWDGSGLDEEFMDFHKMSLKVSITCQTGKRQKH